MPRETLSRDQVVAAAITALDEEGFDALSMRRLAHRLGTAAPTLYWHVRSRDELLDLVADRIVGEVLAGLGAGGGWRASMTGLAISLRMVLRQHPGVGPILGSRPPAGANAAATLERLLDALRTDGFGDADAVLAAITVTQWATGFAVAEAQGPVAEPGAPGAAFPTADERFAFGLAVILDGIEARRAHPRRSGAGDTLRSDDR